MTSEFGNLKYILRFGATTERKIRLPAPLLFDLFRRKGWSFDVVQFDEFVVQHQFHNPMEGVVPDEEEHGEFPPSRERPSPSLVKGLPLLGARILLRERIRGLRCTHRKPHTTLGLTRTTLEQEAPGDISYCQLRPKA